MLFGKSTKRMMWLGLALAVPSGIVAAQQPLSNQQAVWKLERSFCDLTRAGDMASAMKLIDPDFLGWGATGGAPMHKADLAKALDAQVASGTRFQACSIQPIASQAVADMVLVQYIVTNVLVDKAGHITQSRNRVAHTWIERGTTWQMLGGMGSRIADTR
jgi:Domain of unknown function (DUF4440)